MRCLYCHNPDTWSVGGGKEYSAEEVFGEILKYKNYIKNGGVTVSGGEPLVQIDFVTQLLQMLKAEGIHTAVDTSGITFNKSDAGSVRKHGELIKHCDLALLDVKHIDEMRHRQLTGRSNSNTLDFARFLSDNGVDIWIRHVLVPGFTDDLPSLKRLKAFLATLKTVRKVEVLPYHGLGESKYEKLGIAYSLKGTVPPSKEILETAKKILNS